MRAQREQSAQLVEILKRMLELQTLDDQLAQWEKQRLALKKNLEESQSETLACQARQEELKKAIRDEKKKQGLLELEIKSKEEEARKHNAQLGQLSSNEAYKAKLSEIQTCRREIAALEDQVLRLIESEEAIQRQFDEESARLAEQTCKAQEKESGMACEIQALEQKVQKVAAEQGEHVKILSALDKNFAATYLRYHKANRGRVIAKIEQGLCGSCRMKISAHQINEVRKMRDLTYCQNCGVILAVL